MDGESRILRKQQEGELYFSALDLTYAYNHLQLFAETSKQRNIDGNATGTFRFLTGIFGLVDMLAEFQKIKKRTLKNAQNTFLFSDYILLVSESTELEHKN